MSRLPNAPLIEVIFELRWTLIGQQQLQEAQYISGDLYPLIREKFPFREFVQGLPVDFFIHSPTHRFRAAQNDYPLVQLGQGLLTVNVTDEKYFWESFQHDITEVFKKLCKVYSFKEKQTVRPILQYIDLIKFDYEKNDIVKFLEENLHITIKQEFLKNVSPPQNVSLVLNYEVDLGSLNITVAKGKSAAGENGITIHTMLTGPEVKPDPVEIGSWLSKAHVLTSALFKDMTKGKLQELFAKK